MTHHDEYLHRLRQRCPDIEQYRRTTAPLLELLAATGRPTPVSLLMAILHWDPDQLAAARHPVADIVASTGHPRHHATLALAPRDFADWLLNPARPHLYQIGPNGRRKLGVFLWDEYVRVAQQTVVDTEVLHRIDDFLPPSLHAITPGRDTAALARLHAWFMGRDCFEAAATTAVRMLKTAIARHGDGHPDVLPGLCTLCESDPDAPLPDAVLEKINHFTGRIDPGPGGDSDKLAAQLRDRARLASALARSGYRDMARRVQKSAADGYQQHVGRTHPDTLAAIRDLAEYHDDLAIRQALQEDALAICHQLHGQDHAKTVAVTERLIETLSTGGAASERAIQLQQDVVAARTRMLGEAHPDTLAALRALVPLRCRKVGTSGLLPMQRSLVAQHVQCLGDKAIETIEEMAMLAHYHLSVHGDLAGALPLHEQIVAGYRQHYGSDHAHTLWATQDLAALYFLNGEPTRSLALLNRVRRGLTTAEDTDDMTALHLFADLANAHAAQDHAGTARGLWQQVFELAPIPGADDDAINVGQIEGFAMTLFEHYSVLPETTWDEILRLLVRIDCRTFQQEQWHELPVLYNRAMRFLEHGMLEKARALLETLLASIEANRCNSDNLARIVSLHKLAWIHTRLHQPRRAQAINQRIADIGTGDDLDWVADHFLVG